jgi:tetratricopeptide (TPR) repeat protein
MKNSKFISAAGLIGMSSILLMVFAPTRLPAQEAPLSASGTGPAGESNQPLIEILKNRKIYWRTKSLEKESLLRARSERVDFLLRQSREALAAGKAEAARGFARAALLLDPQSQEALARLAEARNRVDRPARKFELFKEEVPHLSEAEKDRMIRFFLLRGDLFSRRKLYDRAVEEYENVFVLSPLHAGASRKIDAVKKRLIREKTEEWKKRARGKNDDLADRLDISMKTVKRLVKEGQYLEAKIILNRAAFLDPSDKEIRRWMNKIRKLERQAGGKEPL